MAEEPLNKDKQELNYRGKINGQEQWIHPGSGLNKEFDYLLVDPGKGKVQYNEGGV